MAVIPIITVDGPSGSGKGTLCARLAHYFSWHFLDSGALYRLVGLAAWQRCIDFADHQALSQLAEQLDVQFIAQPLQVQVVLEQQDVTQQIRTEAVAGYASCVAAIQPVRDALLKRQRDFAQQPGLIADGRDMGTVIFPQAVLKIFLTASAQARAQRRVQQLQQAGQPMDYEQVLQDIQARDHRDMNRHSSPLKPAADAYLIDSTALSAEAVFWRIVGYAKERSLVAQSAPL